MPNFIVEDLPAYVQENRELLIKNFALVGGGTRKRISIQTGIKKDAHINYLNLTPFFQSGEGCGFNPLGAAELTQRVIRTNRLKVNMEICPDTLVGKYAEYLVRIDADENSELPFEAYIMEGLLNEINKMIEKDIWAVGSSVPETFVGIAVNEGQQFTLTSTTAYDRILEVYLRLPDEAIERGAEIYVAPAIFREFVQELVTKNYYHYNPGVADPDEFYFPGSSVKVVKTIGLADVSAQSIDVAILGTFPANLYYGCDIEGASEDIKVWYSADDDVIKIAAKWNMGVQIAFPELAVVGTV